VIKFNIYNFVQIVLKNYVDVILKGEYFKIKESYSIIIIK